VPAVPVAVVPTVTVSGAAVLVLTLTEPGRVQLGAGVTAGVMLQLRFTVPLNDPAGVTTKLNEALFPAGMVDELDDPDARPIVKSGAVVLSSTKVSPRSSEPANTRSCLPSPFMSAAWTKLGWVVL
jgi:hypothetical protein